MGDHMDGSDGYLKVTFRRLQHEEAHGERVLGVFCPRQVRAVDVRECRSCEHCQGLCVDPTDRETFLRCSFEGAEAESAAHGARVSDRPEGDAESARHTPLSAIMTSPARTVGPDTTVSELLALFVNLGISAAPVVDAQGKAIGIVSKSDVLELYAEDDGAELSLAAQFGPIEGGVELSVGAPKTAHERATLVTVRDVMTRLVFSLSADASLSRASALMAYEGVHRIVVTAADGTALGIVSALDVLRWVARRDGYVVPDVTRLQAAKPRE